MIPRSSGLLLAILLLVPHAAHFEVPPALGAPEPEPPRIPQPEPEPQPIPLPKPKPIQEPFPGESDAEKIQRLTQENEALRSKNAELGNENRELELQISKLRQIVDEQLRVILHLLDQIKQTVFAPSGTENKA